MKSLDILVSLPIVLINPLTLDTEALIDISSVSIKSAHNGENCAVEWIYNGTNLILDAIESPISITNPATELNTGVQFGISKMERNRRTIESAYKKHYNHYLQRIIQTDKLQSIGASASDWNEMSLIANQAEEDMFDFNDSILADLPSNRTVHFNCNDGDNKQEFCLQGKFLVTNFKANDSPILITLNFTVDLRNVAKIMNEKKDFLVVRTSVEITKTYDEHT